MEESSHSEYEGPSSGHDHEEEEAMMEMLENKMGAFELQYESIIVNVSILFNHDYMEAHQFEFYDDNSVNQEQVIKSTLYDNIPQCQEIKHIDLKFYPQENVIYENILYKVATANVVFF
jgi:hypothetical protein